MKINYNDLERIYIAAKDCSKGAIEELTTELEIVQTNRSLVVYKNNEVIYQRTDGKTIVPNQLPLETPRGHAAVLNGATTKTQAGKATTFRWLNKKNT